jgi:hypothetical protein
MRDGDGAGQTLPLKGRLRTFALCVYRTQDSLHTHFVRSVRAGIDTVVVVASKFTQRNLTRALTRVYWRCCQRKRASFRRVELLL